MSKRISHESRLLAHRLAEWLGLLREGTDDDGAPYEKVPDLDGNFAFAAIAALREKGLKHFSVETDETPQTGYTFRATFALNERVRMMGIDGSGVPFEGIDYFESPVQENDPVLAICKAADAVREAEEKAGGS